MPEGLAAVAVGGYGRGQLYPHSDVDVLVLLPSGQAPPAAAIEHFFATLWDIGIELSHAVRTIEECEVEMAADVTIRTSLLEHRFLAGAKGLYRQFRRRFHERMDVRAFYDAKALEQQQRHLKYQDAIYNLEPNVKESPGGLRDLASVLWIARAAGFGSTWRELARNGLMTPGEARAVARQERLIGGMRIRLHYLLGRREDRLVFDAQAALAKQLGFGDTSREARERAARCSAITARPSSCARSTRSCCRTCMRSLNPAATQPVADRRGVPAGRRASRRARRAAVREAPVGDARRLPHAAAAPRAEGHDRAHAARALARPPSHRRRASARDPENRERFIDDVPRRARTAARPAADEPLRRARAVPAGVRPHRRPDAARPLPRLHGGRAHPDGDPQPAPLHRGAARARVSAVLAADGRLRAARGALRRAGCSTISRRAAAAIIRRSARRTRGASAASTA